MRVRLADTTPTPWPEATIPTPAEWLRWYDQQTPDNRLTIAANLLEAAQAAGRCLQADHDALLGELRRRDIAYVDTLRKLVRWRRLATRQRRTARTLP